MVKIEKPKAKYLNFESTKNDDVAVIIGEGEYSLDEVSWEKEKIRRIHIPVELNGNKLDWTPWPNDADKCVEVWGDDTSMWVGQKLRITHDKKKMILSPIKQEKPMIAQ